MNVLVTGGAGFLGRRLVRELCAAGLGVRCIVRPSTSIDELRRCVGPTYWNDLQIIRGDLLNPLDCRRAVDGIDIVQHAAAGLSGSTSALVLNTVVPTRRLIDAALETNVKRFVLVSSLGIYRTAGLRRNAVLDETCPVDDHPERRDPYTYSKIAQEAVAWAAHAQHGLPLVVVRPGVIYGPGRGAISNRIGLTVAGRLIRIGGNRPLPYVFVDHCAAALRQAALESGLDGEAFNVLDDDLPSGRRVLRMYRRAGRPVKTAWIPQCGIGALSALYERYSRWSGGQLPPVITRYRSDSLWKPLRYSSTKARNRLHWRPAFDFEETFQRSLNS